MLYFKYTTHFGLCAAQKSMIPLCQAFLLFLMVSLSLPGCKPEADPQVVQSLQQSITQAEKAGAGVKDAGRQFSDLLVLIASAPPHIQENPQVAELREAITRYPEKMKASADPIGEDLQKYAKMLADYQAGKVTTELVKKELTPFQTSITTAEQLAASIKAEYETYNTQYRTLVQELLKGSK